MNDTETKPDRSRTHIGDGVYISHDGFHIVLVTSDGLSDTNTIYLDPHVWEQMKEWAANRSL